MRSFYLIMMVCIGAAFFSGCQFSKAGADQLSSVGAPLSEPAWIRNGEPITFEGGQWFPTDEVENLMNNEVILAGTYRDIFFFLDRTDVKPYDRLYTRFSKNRFRAFEKRQQ